MNKQQLSEQYYQVLSEGPVDVIKNIGKGIGGFLGRNAGTIAKTGLGLGGAAYGISELINALQGTGSGGGVGGGGFGGWSQARSSGKFVDPDVSRALASGDKDSYYDYLAALKNSGMKMNDRSSSISSTRAMAYNMAKDRAKMMKELSLSDKTPKGAAYQKAKAAFEAQKKALGASAYEEDASKDLSGTRPDGSSFTVKGRKMTADLQKLYDEMNKAREEALNQEITVGQMEGKAPTTPAASPSSSNPPAGGTSGKPEEKKPPTNESFLKKYYNILSEVEERPGQPDPEPETPEQKKAREEAAAKAAAEKAAEEKAAKEAAEKAENERLGQSLGTARQSFGRMRSLESGGYNPLKYDRDTGPGSATHYGRILQRGAKITPRTLDQANYRAAAERDIEREGPLDRYKDRGEMYRGMEERGFDLGIGDYYALSQEAKEAKAEFNKNLEDLVAKYGDKDIPEDVLAPLLAKRNKAQSNLRNWPNVR